MVISLHDMFLHCYNTPYLPPSPSLWLYHNLTVVWPDKPVAPGTTQNTSGWAVNEGLIHIYYRRFLGSVLPPYVTLSGVRPVSGVLLWWTFSPVKRYSLNLCRPATAASVQSLEWCTQVQQFNRSKQRVCSLTTKKSQHSQVSVHQRQAHCRMRPCRGCFYSHG